METVLLSNQTDGKEHVYHFVQNTAYGLTYLK